MQNDPVATETYTNQMYTRTQQTCQSVSGSLLGVRDHQETPESPAHPLFLHLPLDTGWI